MRVLILNQFCQPEPAFQGVPFAKRLVQAGFEVEILTGFPNYPGGKIYPGYRVRPYREERIDGIRVHRAALYPSHDRSGVRRMLNYLSFGLGSLLFGARHVKPVRVVFCYSLVTLIFTALFLRWRDRAKIVHVIQDLWPESVAHSGMMRNRILHAILRRFCDFAYGRADKLVVIAPGMRDVLVSRGIPAERIKVIYNWSEQEEDVGEAPRDATLAKEYGLSDTFNVMYAGNMGGMQALDNLLDAARLLRETHPEVRIVLLGGGTERERLATRAQTESLRNVVFLPRQPPEAMPRVYSLANAVIVQLKDIPLFSVTVPSKTQACLAAGLPILMGVRGDAADLVETAGAGVRYEPENARSLADAILKLRAMSAEKLRAMGRRGREHYMNHLSREVGTAAYADVFRQVAGEDSLQTA